MAPMSTGRVVMRVVVLSGLVGGVGTALLKIFDASDAVFGMAFVLMAALAGVIAFYEGRRLPPPRRH